MGSNKTTDLARLSTRRSLWTAGACTGESKVIEGAPFRDSSDDARASSEGREAGADVCKSNALPTGRRCDGALYQAALLEPILIDNQLHATGFPCLASFEAQRSSAAQPGGSHREGRIRGDEVGGLQMADDQKERAGSIVHYAFGGVVGALYGAAA